ncbi:ABC transporter ATP-binding protein [Bacillus sp. 31A1R]|uniref:ABC transporter ATP-binding protein n=1 Tax=Robertmurraya mangrovi TaxID=3098077 RepID=A0ABU5IW94_9BACI|nr:ABC transporter ATP-binding protein [Bacillus sp. 31A1R]MDZ5471425.1 ABC transporter ATP-binding protein [Bacillus sp. 31A1R]
MLVVKNVTKNFGSFCALKDINLEFSNGVYGLLAPNGAGKTTLIKMLSTLIFPTKGEILYNGSNIIEMDEQYRDLLGYLPQDFGFYNNYSPTQYLLYIAALKGIDKKKAKDRVEELLKLVALEDVKGKKMKKFSGGMIQRVGIAQAMLNDPKILILDEPTAGLDPKERVRFRNLLTDLARDRIVILSTHIVSDVESIANEIVMIKDQQLLYKDTIQNICQMIEGMVYETYIDYPEAASFRKQYFSLSEKQEGNSLKLRFISKTSPNTAWNSVSPSLEDVFLYIYQDMVTDDVL